MYRIAPREGAVAGAGVPRGRERAPGHTRTHSLNVVPDRKRVTATGPLRLDRSVDGQLGRRQGRHRFLRHVRRHLLQRRRVERGQCLRKPMDGAALRCVRVWPGFAPEQARRRRPARAAAAPWCASRPPCRSPRVWRVSGHRLARTEASCSTPAAHAPADPASCGARTRTRACWSSAIASSAISTPRSRAISAS